VLLLGQDGGKLVLSTGASLAQRLLLHSAEIGNSFKGGKNMQKFKRALVAMVFVLSASCQSVTGRTAGQNVDDATITASVKSTLVADKVANLTRVDVDTTLGVVSLNGVVESADQKSRAEQLANRVSGVRKVVNNLQIQKRSS